MVGGYSAAVSEPIRRKPKWAATLGGKSEEAIWCALSSALLRRVEVPLALE